MEGAGVCTVLRLPSAVGDYKHTFSVASWSIGRLLDQEVRVSSLALDRSTLVLEKGYLKTFLRLSHTLQEYLTIGSESPRVMHFICYNSVGSEGNLVGNGLPENPCKAFRASNG
ncbi:hypothetical protein ElyMa_006966500 [Elysia marginata]|uniref:Uncharacterized protein n=1 Tax=Elysia marginata TaxID=1093978 RepID=A0AAV4JK13_9GAST|nr:hypothetical protein ElyMa_006966500 [Elysia marginata]